MKATTGASLGNISLTVSIGGLIVTEIALGHELIVGPGWKVLLQAFEAATIGGLADGLVYHPVGKGNRVAPQISYPNGHPREQ